MTAPPKPDPEESSPLTDSAVRLEVEGSFRRAFDAHGYGFQYAVLARAQELFPRLYWSPWQFEAAEFPVRVQDASTRIDFILRRQRTSLLLVCECKRANPALARWCFARAPFMAASFPDTEVLVEGVTRVDPLSPVLDLQLRSSTHTLSQTERVYNVGIEVKTGRTGDAAGRRKDEIEEAVTQVLRGTNGLVELVRARPELVPEPQPWYLVPVVFTTAELWVSDVRLEKTSLTSGEADWTDTTLKRTEWVALNYHLSPGIRHRVASAKEQRALGKILRHEYTRTVFIVGADGVDAFLTWSSQQA